MLRALTKGCTKMVEKFLPDAFLFACILSIVCYILALIFTPSGPMDVLMAWGGGVWNLLAFTAEMATIMVFGYAFAKTAAVEKILGKFIAVCAVCVETCAAPHPLGGEIPGNLAVIFVV